MSTSSLSPRRCSSVCSGRANSACTNNRSCKACLITTHDLIRTSPKEDASLNRIPPRLAIIDLTVDEDEEKERQESRKWQSLKRKYRDADSDVEIVNGPYVKRAKFQHASISCSSSNATSSCSSSPSPSPSSSSSPLPSLSSSSSSHFAPSLSSRYTWRSSFQERSSFLRDNWPRGLYTYEIAAGFKSMAAEELEARFNALSSRFVHIFEYRFTETTAEVFMAHQALWNSLSEVDQANGIRLGPSEAGLWTEYLHSLGRRSEKLKSMPQELKSTPLELKSMPQELKSTPLELKSTLPKAQEYAGKIVKVRLPKVESEAAAQQSLMPCFHLMGL
ncbi:hypothetical protein BT96DRAFT_975188 [Gymnopus androsaceus JB14]|uniref:Uncharacterized protein n=1 Tax=Gymnopus androsaceus JB14 TaxID=1447944 RepID=A0A6A4HRV1_9AGAR|nr:hypothetical protein BT96DRAFT_975188 [Gymnopus androsaceus JB14]